MFFFSIEFGVVFVAFFIAYWCLHKHLAWQNALLLVFNYAILWGFGSFYFALVLALYTLFIFGASFMIAGGSGSGRAGLLAAIALVVCNFRLF